MQLICSNANILSIVSHTGMHIQRKYCNNYHTLSSLHLPFPNKPQIYTALNINYQQNKCTDKETTNQNWLKSAVVVIPDVKTMLLYKQYD